MLCISKVRSGGHAYYLDIAEGGRGTAIEPAGVWIGEGSEEIGLRGAVDERQIRAVLSGNDPITETRLGPAHDRVQVAAFDLTFCAPKSVSILHGLGDHDVADEVRASHETAVETAVGYLERRALAVTRDVGDHGGRMPVECRAVAAAGFLHRVSRAGDPHLHTHVVVANLARDSRAVWSALDGRGIYAHAGAAAALYQAGLRHELVARLGVAWGPLDRGRADLEGVAPEVRVAFSTRAAQIAAHLRDRGLDVGRSGRALLVAGHATRPERDPTLPFEALRPEWHRRALELGFGPHVLESVIGRAHGAPDPAERFEVRDQGLDSQGLDPSEIVSEDRYRGFDGKGPQSTRGQQLVASLTQSGRELTRRDVVRGFASLSHEGSRSEDLEHRADRLLSKMSPAEGWRGEADGPGVAERRYRPLSRELEMGDHLAVVSEGPGRRAAGPTSVELERERLEVQLRRRGLSLRREPERDMGLGIA